MTTKGCESFHAFEAAKLWGFIYPGVEFCCMYPLQVSVS